ncbi:MAG: integrase arm-type DNA-binding domain-containing protein [Desulfuromonadaceae bacterium]|nr:integrase arm-type DNA-binding domain-containing protein [Desulfuromonadaceae bacterium]MDD5104875.1 integrase arm-type DNA-binding domain-containing protein [Desulfuromonadaceae bacterium]
MPKKIVPLSDIQVSKAKPKDKPYKLTDGGGLFILITPTGGKLWNLKYRFSDKEKKLSFGTYPALSLADARQRREDARKLLANGIDPGEIKKAQKAATHAECNNSFEVIARAWHAVNVPSWSASHAKTTLERLEKNIFPWVGSKAITEIKLADIKSVLHRVEQRAPESARRIYVSLNMILRYCVATERLDRNPLEGLRPRDILTTDPIQHHFPAIIDPKELAILLRAIDQFKGSYVTRCAMQLASLWFCRPGDLRKAEWSEIDFELAELNIPVERMKLTAKEKAKRRGESHCIPLSAQAIEILRQLQPLTGHSKYIFPGHRTPLKPMSEGAITAALIRMGYKDEMSWHGFRACARTILDEVLGFRPDFIEHQLAHAVRDALGRAYNRTTHLPERKKMMQVWSDYLDGLKAGAKVIPIRAAA